MQSNGGAVSVPTASREAVRTLLSGPAGGVIGALHAARRIGAERIITFDMGGTSTDVSLADGEARLHTEWSIADLPVKVPAIDIHTVGAGGGSLAYLDAGGALDHRGTARPGPATPRLVDQDPAHRRRRGGEEVAAAIPARVVVADDPQVRLVHQRGRLERVIDALPRQVGARQMAQLLVDLG